MSFIVNVHDMQFLVPDKNISFDKQVNMKQLLTEFHLHALGLKILTTVMRNN